MLLLIFLTAFTSVVFGFWFIVRPKPSVVSRRLLASNSQELTRDRRLEGGFLRRVIAPTFAKAGNRAVRDTCQQNTIRSIERLLIAAIPSHGRSRRSWASGSRPSPARPGFIVYLARGPGRIDWASAFSRRCAAAVFRCHGPVRDGPRPGPSAVQKSIIRALPDGLDLLVTCVEAGMGADAAFATVTERTDGPLSDAFALYLLREVGLGRSRREALQSAADRTGVDDLIGLAVSVNRAEELGTTLGDVLRIQAKDLREIRRTRAQEAAQKAPVKMTIPLALCFLPAMGSVIVVPAIINLVRFFGEATGS